MYRWYILVTVVALAGGFASGVLFVQNTDTSSQQVRLGEGKFTNPLLECDIAENTINAEKINFAPALREFVEDIQQTLGVEEIAVYYRDLNNGPTFGINQDDPFVPASLLKVPVMIAYYKRAESDPSVLEQRIFFAKRQTAITDQQVTPEQTLRLGTEYPVAELIEKMIRYSDNESLVLLFQNLPIADQAHLYSLLGVDQSVISNPQASLSVKQYAAFFRILFNASFLSQERSEQALTLLTESTFDQGLREGVPDTVAVAHKFGERRLSNTNQQQFHDCGIVYYPKHPYLLCIMTRGKDISTLERSIAEISGFVYKKIDAQYR